MSAPFAPIELSRVAAVLDSLAHEIETLGHQLCGDPDLLVRFMGELQRFDRIAQFQRELAGLLRADCHQTALGQLRMDELAELLTGN